MKARPLPRGRLTTSRLKAPRQMQRSARLLHSATHSVLPFMTAIRLACAKHEVRRLPRQLARGSSARHLVPTKQASTRQASLPAHYGSSMTEARDIELLFAIWEQNVETVRALNRSLKQDPLPKSGIAPQLVNHLKQCAIALVKPGNRADGSDHRMANVPATKSARPKIDKSVLAIGEPKRIRCKEHLRFVASQPCLICGRSPAHAHHVRYAQSRGLSLKVSDEFTVPLCATHHHHIHTTGKEREWWQERNIDPLKVASTLWQQSREQYPEVRGAKPPKFLEDSADNQGGTKASDDGSIPADAPDPFDSAST